MIIKEGYDVADAIWTLFAFSIHMIVLNSIIISVEDDYPILSMLEI